MPHLTIEYTTNLKPRAPFDDLFARLHATLADLGGINKGNCKSRAMGLDRFRIGEGAADAAFVHLDVRFLEGRAASVKQQIGKSFLTILRENFPPPNEIRDLQITVEIRDIERGMYFKHPEGSLDYTNA
ncbi:MAG: 5-carboxymethyl-2-hydroxymuconate Delta-isomerase [Gemmatimonadales bacterium]|jgi:5-carboxymethyl-2-hydroxymuconate isomerase